MYESFYKLRAKPFQLSPDPRFFFNSRGHKRALAYLRYGVRQGEGFIIITGDVGTGKTTLVGTLFRALEGQNVITAQVVTTQLQADDLIRVVAASYGLPYERVNKATLLRRLEDYFRACVREGKRVLLVVDEAQNLPRRAIEELRMLSNFHHQGRSLLQSFLLGQKEFRTTLRSEAFEQLRQRVIAAYHLRPLDVDETRGYIEHRLLTAGWSGDPRIAEDLYPAIYEFTGGVPRRINTLCDRLLLYGYLEEIHTLDTKALEAVSEEMLEEQGAPPAESAMTQARQYRLGSEAPRREPAERREPARAESEEAEAVGGAERGAQPGHAVDEEDHRLEAVERSVSTLAETMRQEISLLREVLADRERHRAPDPDYFVNDDEDQDGGVRS